ncbi:MAG: anthranilate phosphoribosyltransferase [Candidatus Omnitrophota bacterium]
MIKDAIKKIKGKDHLSEAEMQVVFEEIMTGKTTEPEIEQLLVCLSQKGEAIEEITGAARAMRKFVRRIDVSSDVVLDTCGTGGDKSGTFNISTVAAFVVAGCGITVAKHGNRSVSSACGSADLLEALGVDIQLGPEALKRCLEKVGIAFLFAPNLHPAMRYAMPVRKKLKMRTIFNILGPLTNPAFATHQFMGVFDEKLVKPLAHVLANLGTRHAIVAHGLDGLDELTTTTESLACEFKDGNFKSFRINPQDFGIKTANPQDLKGSDCNFNAEIALEILKGVPGPKQDIVLLNSGCAIYVADKARDLGQGIDLARESIDSGRALGKLEALKKFSKSNI